MIGAKTAGLCPAPRKLFEKSLIKNFIKKTAQTSRGFCFDFWGYVIAGLTRNLLKSKKIAGQARNDVARFS